MKKFINKILSNLQNLKIINVFKLSLGLTKKRTNLILFFISLVSAFLTKTIFNCINVNQFFKTYKLKEEKQESIPVIDDHSSFLINNNESVDFQDSLNNQQFANIEDEFKQICNESERCKQIPNLPDYITYEEPPLIEHTPFPSGSYEDLSEYRMFENPFLDFELEEKINPNLDFEVEFVEENFEKILETAITLENLTDLSNSEPHQYFIQTLNWFYPQLSGFSSLFTSLTVKLIEIIILHPMTLKMIYFNYFGKISKSSFYNGVKNELFTLIKVIFSANLQETDSTNFLLRILNKLNRAFNICVLKIKPEKFWSKSISEDEKNYDYCDDKNEKEYNRILNIQRQKEIEKKLIKKNYYLFSSSLFDKKYFSSTELLLKLINSQSVNNNYIMAFIIGNRKYLNFQKDNIPQFKVASILEIVDPRFPYLILNPDLAIFKKQPVKLHDNLILKIKELNKIRLIKLKEIKQNSLKIKQEIVDVKVKESEKRPAVIKKIKAKVIAKIVSTKLAYVRKLKQGVNFFNFDYREKNNSKIKNFFIEKANNLKNTRSNIYIKNEALELDFSLDSLFKYDQNKNLIIETLSRSKLIFNIPLKTFFTNDILKIVVETNSPLIIKTKNPYFVKLFETEEKFYANKDGKSLKIDKNNYQLLNNLDFTIYQELAKINLPGSTTINPSISVSNNEGIDIDFACLKDLPVYPDKNYYDINYNNLSNFKKRLTNTNFSKIRDLFPFNHRYISIQNKIVEINNNYSFKKSIKTKIFVIDKELGLFQPYSKNNVYLYKIENVIIENPHLKSNCLNSKTNNNYYCNYKRIV